MRRRRRELPGTTTTAIGVAALALWVVACAPEAELDDAAGFERLDDLATGTDYASALDTGIERWRDELPSIEELVVTSSLDDADQEVLWLPPDMDADPVATGPDAPRPLLVVLHSWSVDLTQHLSIPYASWAEEHGWAFVAPDFRGEFDRPDAAGSELAIQDVIDAIDHVDGLADLDLDRTFVTGLSGGGMMALLMAGHHPDRFAGAATFVPVHTLVSHYEHTARELPDQDYPQEIEAICGGDPTEEPHAREECLARSPATYLEDIRDAGVPVYLGHGLQDGIVPPDASLRIFDGLADEGDRVGEQAIEATDTGRLPDELAGRIDAETHFGDGDPEVVFARGSGPVTIVIYDDEHDLVYDPGLAWMAELAAAS